jgi:CheY-like chemotaxis protein
MSPKEILIVDDSRAVLKAFSMKLEANGYKIQTAQDGGAALELVRRRRPDLILLDINFPAEADFDGGVAWDGFLILDWLHRMDESIKIPVIVISGDNRAKHEERARAAGAANFMCKPVKPEELLAAVRRALGEEVSTSPLPTDPQA